MKIILKFLLRSIAEKRLRTALIVLSISLSAALFFASNAFALTFAKMITERYTGYYGNSDLVIWSNEHSPHWLFSMGRAEELSNRFDYIIGSLNAGGVYFPTPDSSENLSLRGFDLEDIDLISPLNIVSEGELYPFTGNKVIMSTVFAEKYGLKVGDRIKVKVNGGDHRLKIVATVLPTGFFQDSPRRTTMIIPRKKLARAYNAYGRVSELFIKAKEGESVYALMNELRMRYKRYTVREPINQAELKQELMGITVPLQMMTVLILCMTVFIIYTSFKVITIERLPIIGTFRSVGATKGTTDLILILESLAYGVIGGVTGVLLGILILFAMAYKMSYNAWSDTRMDVVLHFEAFHVITAFLLGLVLAVVSSLLPIIKISRISIKDIVLNKVDNKVSKGYVKTIVGVILLTASVLVPIATRQLPPGPMVMIPNVISMVVLLISVIMLVPFFTKGFIALLERLFLLLFGNEGVIAVKNIKGNKGILNNISLLSIGIAGILMINIVSYSVGLTIGNAYSTAKFDAWMWIWKGDRSTELILRTIDGVTEARGELELYSVEVKGTDYKIGSLVGSNKDILNFFEMDIPPALFDGFDEARNILLSYNIKAAIGVENGDIVTLVMGGKKERRYRVKGFFNTDMNNGSYAIIPPKYFKVDTGTRTYSNFKIKTDPAVDTAEVVKRIEKKLERRRPWIRTLSQMEANEKESFGQIMFILKGFSVLTLLIGIFGVLNNLIISFIQRKRSLAMYRSIGMSRGQIIKMIFIESLSGGLIGGITGTCAGLFLAFIVANVTEALNLGLTIYYSPLQTVISALAGAVITVIASISPALKSSKMNIIEAIKYE